MSSPVIRKALESDYPTIQKFLAREWSPDHVFVKYRDLLEWQHLDHDSSTLNFLLLESDNEIQSLLGYIPYRHWSSSAPENRVFLAIWKTASDSKVAGAGFHLLQQVRKTTKTDFIGAIGISTTALPIYERLGYKTGLMDHFAIFNPDPPKRFLQETPQQDISRGLVSWEELSFQSDVARVDRVCRTSNSGKNAQYLSARYGSHPSYTYQAHSMTLRDDEIILITRIVEVQGSLICRVVDAVGDYNVLSQSAGAIRALIQDKGYVYADLYSTGLDVAEMSSGGFFVRKPDSRYTMPNDFEPLVMKNKELLFAWKNFGPKKDIVLFRGDSDQDRPNFGGRVKI